MFLQSLVTSIHAELKKLYKISLVHVMPTQRDIVGSREKNSLDNRNQNFLFSAVRLALPASMQTYICLPLSMELIKSFAANVASLW